MKNELDGITDYDLEEKSKEWNRTLLDYVQPYILICEGYEVRDKLYEWYPDEFEMYDEYTGKLSLDSGDIDVLVIKRNHSNIQDKASVSSELSDLISNNDLTFIDDDDCDDCNCDCDDDDDCDDCNCDCDCDDDDDCNDCNCNCDCDDDDDCDDCNCDCDDDDDDDDCDDCNCDCDDDDDCDDCNCDCDDDDDCDDEDSDGSNSYVSPIVLASILTRKKK